MNICRKAEAACLRVVVRSWQADWSEGGVVLSGVGSGLVRYLAAYRHPSPLSLSLLPSTQPPFPLSLTYTPPLLSHSHLSPCPSSCLSPATCPPIDTARISSESVGSSARPRPRTERHLQSKTVSPKLFISSGHIRAGFHADRSSFFGHGGCLQWLSTSYELSSRATSPRATPTPITRAWSPQTPVRTVLSIPACLSLVALRVQLRASREGAEGDRLVGTERAHQGRVSSPGFCTIASVTTLRLWPLTMLTATRLCYLSAQSRTRRTSSPRRLLTCSRPSCLRFISRPTL